MTQWSSLQPHFVVWSNNDNNGNMRSSIDNNNSGRSGSVCFTVFGHGFWLKHKKQKIGLNSE